MTCLQANGRADCQVTQFPIGANYREALRLPDFVLGIELIGPRPSGIDALVFLSRDTELETPLHPRSPE